MRAGKIFIGDLEALGLLDKVSSITIVLFSLLFCGYEIHTLAVTR